MVYNLFSTLMNLVCYYLVEDLYIDIHRDIGLWFSLLVVSASVSDFGIRVMLDSWNESENVPSSSVFWIVFFFFFAAPHSMWNFAHQGLNV